MENKNNDAFVEEHLSCNELFLFPRKPNSLVSLEAKALGEPKPLAPENCKRPTEVPKYVL